jgi:hypothetical protein
MDLRCIGWSGGVPLFRVLHDGTPLFTGPLDPCRRVLATHRGAAGPPDRPPGRPRRPRPVPRRERPPL